MMGEKRKGRINERTAYGNERACTNRNMKTSFTSLMESSAEVYSHQPPSRRSLGQIGKQACAQLEHRFPGAAAALLCSFIFQGQMVFASLTFIADVVLDAGVFSTCSISFTSIHSLLVPLPCHAPRSSLWQRDNWISQQVEFTGSQENLVPTAEPLHPGKTLQWKP